MLLGASLLYLSNRSLLARGRYDFYNDPNFKKSINSVQPTFQPHVKQDWTTNPPLADEVMVTSWTDHNLFGILTDRRLFLLWIEEDLTQLKTVRLDQVCELQFRREEGRIAVKSTNGSFRVGGFTRDTPECYQQLIQMFTDRALGRPIQNVSV